MKILSLKLFSANIIDQIEFYSRVLGAEILNQSKSSVTFKIGNTNLIFEESSLFHPYHFAINIPDDSESQALEFIKKHAKILNHEGSEIIDYDNWNAKALYFYDADRNIVELISRYDLNYLKNDRFDKESLIEISEIGLATNNIEREFDLLNRTTGIGIYDGNFDRFCAVGDQHGLFICINKELKGWFPTNEKAYASSFEMIMDEKGEKYEVVYREESLEIRKL